MKTFALKTSELAFIGVLIPVFIAYMGFIWLLSSRDEPELKE